MSFAPAAARLAGLAARHLGWRPDEFWAATPAELALSLADPTTPSAPPSRQELARMMERDPDGR
ncbi:MAG: phage tail assembly chaperone [Sphingomonadales bacterium]|nr:phage tail assembly chaperone [Sphingomonadales bacterium]MBD3773780.1 phage tail assembly chaperone [Paracoccaceae bacterium]